MNVELGMRPRGLISANICFEFSVHGTAVPLFHIYTIRDCPWTQSYIIPSIFFILTPSISVNQFPASSDGSI